MRFGNKAFRDWHARLLDRAEALVQELLTLSEVRYYIICIYIYVCVCVCGKSEP